MKRLTEQDRQRILDYIAYEPEMNLFLFGDVENFGVDREPVSVFAQGDGEWNAILLRYFDNFLVYSRSGDFDAEEIAGFFRDRDGKCLSGKSEFVHAVARYLPELTEQPTFLCRMRHVKAASRPCGEEPRLLSREELPEAVELLMGIEEFAASFRNGLTLAQQVEREELNIDHGCVFCGMFREGKLVSVAATAAANSRSAMVVSVATAPTARDNGYASRVVEYLCRSELSSGREFLCLFYDNPDAGRIYRRIGFEEIGSYSMLR